MAEKPANRDELVAAKAARQHGVVSTRQLRKIGLSHDAILGRVRAGRLHRLHRGVYAVGHRAISFRGRCTAATLAVAGSVVSHRSAAELWGLLGRRDGPIHVSVPTASGRERRTGIQIHRRPALQAGQVARRYGIRVTTPAVTIADLRSSEADTQLRRAIRQAEVIGLHTGVEPVEPTRSELEVRFLQLCEEHGLPRPEVNVRIGRWEVDFLWRDQRLVVETDGYRYHRGPTAFEDDHARDLALRTRGLTVLRLTYHQVTTNPTGVATIIRRELKSTSQPTPLTS